MKASTPLSSLTSAAIETGRGFTVGNLEPRLVTNSNQQPLHVLPVGEVAGGIVSSVLRPCLLVDVGMPERFVRIPLLQDDKLGPHLGTAELWRHSATLGSSDSSAIQPGYVELFDELAAA